jgi:hypothetical protein
MKQLQKSDLVDGEIYKQLDFNYIFLYNKNQNNNVFSNGSAIKNFNYYKRWSANGFYKPMIEATLEEKHWLKECIKADKFISYEEVMKTFVPEFTLLEKWYINTRLLNDDQLQKLVDYLRLINKDNDTYRVKNIKNWYPFIGSDIGAHYIVDPQFINDSYQEITFDQFEKHVLKEETITTKATVETKSKFIDNNTVETSEGSIFKVGDLVTPFESSSPNKGKKFKITGFRWNNAQTEICAITELHKPNGIGVDKLEIYIEPKVKENLTLPKNLCVEIPLVKEESLLDKTKRLYPFGTKFKNAYRGKLDKDVIFKIDGNNIYNPQYKKQGIHYGNNWLVFNDQWAEIIEYPQGFTVG